MNDKEFLKFEGSQCSSCHTDRKGKELPFHNNFTLRVGISFLKTPKKEKLLPFWECADLKILFFC